MNDKGTVLIYCDEASSVFGSLSSDSERGQLITAILDYAQYGEIPDFSGGLKVGFAVLRASIDRSFAAWEKKREKCSAGGKKSAAQRAIQSSDTEATSTTLNHLQPPQLLLYLLLYLYL